MLYLSKADKRLIAKEVMLQAARIRAEQELADLEAELVDLEAKIEARRLMAGKPLAKPGPPY